MQSSSSSLRLLTMWAVVITLIAIGEGSWGSPGHGQYHIQTDEGPERYFRFQTDNGQFRKEKRLQDGTVIGTEAWIDAAGFLRQKDYIADKKGYRILKSKTVFVGQGRQIEDAIKSTKSTAAQSGVLVNGSNGLANTRPNSVAHISNDPAHGGYVYSTTPIPATTTTTTATPTPAPTTAPAALPPRLGYLSPAQAAKLEPSPYLGFDHYPDELPPPVRNPLHHQPVVQVRPHSEPVDQQHPSNSIAEDYNLRGRYHAVVSSTTTARPPPALPSLDMQPPLVPHYRRLRPIAVIPTSTTAIPADEAYEHSAFVYSTPTPARAPVPFEAAVASTTTPAPIAPGYNYAPSPTAATYGERNYYATAAPSLAHAGLPYDVNSLEAGGLLPPPRPTHYRRLQPQPQTQQQPHPLVRNNEINAAEYDGVGVTRNGFRYVLPQHYHEEEQIDEQKRAGSFGYVDPFGIRRVVYYNASPERGFVHRNNNRYVGVGATPYDPPA